MRYLSVFSGIEAASVAFAPLGWEPVAFSEVGEFPGAVLAHRFPHVPNLGDIRKVDWGLYRGRVGLVVRRLTPVECERLQGFEDDWTRVPYRGRPASECPDGPRYKAIGNSMAVPVMRWIGERMQVTDDA